MTIIGQEKPSLEDLAHFGVLGMKWGHRKAATGKDIRAARRRLNTSANKFDDQRDRVKETEKGTKARADAKKKLEKMRSDWMKDPDRVIASRMTRGEKAAALIIAGPFGLIPIAATSAISRTIERKQDKRSGK